MQRRRLRIGSRESALAVAQAKLIIRQIHRTHPEIEIELVTMKTTGDRILDRPLDQVGGKGLFVKELDQALEERRIDLSVHSLKDMPMELPPQLPIVAYSHRADPRDVLIMPYGEHMLDLSKPIGCSSARRRILLQRIYPNAQVKSVRGNVLTRLAKLDCGEYGALVLAHAGISRLGLQERISRVFEISEMIPAAGQGILAVQGRRGEDFSFLHTVNDPAAQAAAVAERAFVAQMGGGCSAPIAAYAQITEGILLLTGMYHNEKTGDTAIDAISGPVDAPQALGEQLAMRLGGKR